jgi:hypothetical protein
MHISKCTFLTLQSFANDPQYRKGAGKPGVYIWGFSLESNDYSIPTKQATFFPYYVGKTQKCLAARTYEHVCNLKGGSYPVFDVVAAQAAGTLIGNVLWNYQKASKGAAKTVPIAAGPTLPNPIFPELLHFPEGVHAYWRFLTDVDILRQTDWMMKHFCVLFFEVENPTAVQLNKLEKHMGNLVGYDKLITKPYSDPKMNVTVTCKNGKQIDLESYSDLFKCCSTQMASAKFGL